MSSTRAAEVRIHAVSPLSICETGAATAGAAGATAAGAAGCWASAAVAPAARRTSVSIDRLSRFTRVSFRRVLQGRLVAFARADADGGLHRRDEDLAVADVAGLRGRGDDLGDLVDDLVRHDDLHLDLGEEVDRVLAAAIQLGVALLTPEPPHLGHRHANHADAGEGFLDVVELERLDDRLDLLHRVLPDATV